MQKEIQLRLTPDIALQEEALRRHCAAELHLAPGSIRAMRLLRKSIDARQRRVFVNLTVLLFIDEDEPSVAFEPIRYGDVSRAPRVVVVGAGPAGLFAALHLIELGLCPILLERGKDVHERRKDIARIKQHQAVDPESNYACGEGGAGAYSDGTL